MVPRGDRSLWGITAMEGNRAARRREETELIKISLNLPRFVLDMVEELASRESMSKTAVIRRAIELKKFLDDAMRSDGKLLVKHGDDVKEVVFR